MLIEVIPFGGSIDNRGLTYFVTEELAKNIRIGCLVEVPFRNALDYAIVTKIETPVLGDEVENLRSIVRIVTNTPLLSLYQIRSIFDISAYYFVHIHHILSLFLSKLLVRYLEKKGFAGLIPQEGSEREKAEKDIRFHHHTGDASFFSVISGNMREKTVVVFPDDFALEAYLRECPVDAENTLVVPDKLTETKKYRTYCSAYNGEKDIIIWTRRVLYYNLSRYENILYVEDSLHNRAMRFGHSYKHTEILRRLVEYGDFRITILSTLPSIESMYLLHSGVYIRTKD